VTLWLDAQISPKLRVWMRREFGIEVIHVRDLGLREATDARIFAAARKAAAVLLTKDEDFVDLVERLGTPPQVVWLTCGNVSNTRLKLILSPGLRDALAMVRAGEPIVEISNVNRTASRKTAARRRTGRREARSV
jgi:predicted nuclease of predicted toxin-antitoxin system